MTLEVIKKIYSHNIIPVLIERFGGHTYIQVAVETWDRIDDVINDIVNEVLNELEEAI